MIALVVVAITVGYLAGVGATFQLAEALDGSVDRAFRWLASWFWPITASIAAGAAIARKLQTWKARPPRAVAIERRRGA